jgi:hypothetical protein
MARGDTNSSTAVWSLPNGLATSRRKQAIQSGGRFFLSPNATLPHGTFIELVDHDLALERRKI